MQAVTFNSRQVQRISSAVRAVEQIAPARLYPTPTDRNRQLVEITSSVPNSVGFYPAKWILSDTATQSHSPQSDVWAWPISAEAQDGDFLEGAHVGDYEGKAVFRGAVIGGDFPDILKLVTNVCLGGAGNPVAKIQATGIVEVTGGVGSPAQLVIGTYNAKPGTVKIKGSVEWSDPSHTSYAGEEFTFELSVGSTLYTGAPTYNCFFSGPEAKKVVEYTWTVTFAAEASVSLSLLGYRSSGSHNLSSSANTFIEVEGSTSDSVIEYRQVVLPKLLALGPKVCKKNPKDCCVDDDSSQTASLSRMNVACCNVPVPTSWKVFIPRLNFGVQTWIGGFGDYYKFDDYYNQISNDISEKWYTLSYEGVVNGSCVFSAEWDLGTLTYKRNTLPSDSGYTTVNIPRSAWDYTGGPGPKIYFVVRTHPPTSPLFYDYLAAAWINAPELTAFSALNIWYPYYVPGIGGSNSVQTFQSLPWILHYTDEFEQTRGAWSTSYESTFGESLPTFPAPASSCNGMCSFAKSISGGGAELWRYMPWFIEVTPND